VEIGNIAENESIRRYCHDWVVIMEGLREEQGNESGNMRVL
jgi:hypothetical protein